MRAAILAHEKFPERAKTAEGLLRYGDHEIAAVIDRDTAGDRVNDHLSDVQDAPIVAGIEDVSEEIETLIIGIAPIGGGFDESWRSDVSEALSRGCDVWAGLHYFLSDDPEFVELATKHDAALWDLRRPPDDLTVSQGVASDIDATIVLTVGTDCSTGKMTTTMELVHAAREQGLDAGFVPTGQTGVMIDGDGIVVDRVISDFAAGAVEGLLLDRADHDYLFVEGQGSIVHPAYSGVTCSILHGAMPDALVLCHEADRQVVHGYESFSLPTVPEITSLYERLAHPVSPCSVVGGALNTSHLSEEDAYEAIDTYEQELGAKATDPVRFDASAILEGLER